MMVENQKTLMKSKDGRGYVRKAATDGSRNK